MKIPLLDLKRQYSQIQEEIEDKLVSIFLNQQFKNLEVSIYISEFSRNAKNFLNRFSNKFPEFNVSFKKDVSISSYDAILIVDTNSLSQIKLNNNENISSLKIPYIFIDHHYLGQKSDTNTLNLTFQDYSSTSEIILDLFEVSNIPLTIPILLVI